MRVPTLDTECLITPAFRWPHVVLCHTAARVSPVSAAGRVPLAHQADSAATPLASGQFSLHHCWQFARSRFATPTEMAHRRDYSSKTHGTTAARGGFDFRRA